ATWIYVTLPGQLRATTSTLDGIRAVFVPTGGFFPSSGTLSGGIAVSRATLNVAGITAQNKTYDGTTAAPLDVSSANFTGLLAGDVVSVAAAAGTFAVKDVGVNIPVAISNLTLGGAQGGNYVAVLDQTAPTASIA